MIELTFKAAQALGIVEIVLPSCMALVTSSSQVIDTATDFPIAANITQNKVFLVTNSNSVKVTNVINPTEECFEMVRLSTFNDPVQKWLVTEQYLALSFGCIGNCASCSNAEKSICTSCVEP